MIAFGGNKKNVATFSSVFGGKEEKSGGFLIVFGGRFGKYVEILAGVCGERRNNAERFKLIGRIYEPVVRDDSMSKKGS